jgi:NitT/TauT family transport system permease protein
MSLAEPTSFAASPRLVIALGWLKSVGYSAVAILLLMTIWEGALIFFDVPLWLAPKPSDFMARFFADLPLLFQHAVATSTTLILGFLLGVAIAVPLALAIVSIPALQRGLFPVIVFLNIMPKTVVGRS